MNELVQIDGDERLKEALDAPLSVIYKHSGQCWISALAQRQLARFAKQNQGIPVYRVDVIYDRGISQRVAEFTSVPHASPQAIVVREGAVVGQLTHLSIRAKTLAQLVGVT